MDTLIARLPPKSAVEAGFKAFRELFAGQRTTHVLLEGLEFRPDAGQWRVVIGFDTGRSKETGHAYVNAGIGQKTVEPIREFRAIIIDAASGDFVQVEGV